MFNVHGISWELGNIELDFELDFELNFELDIFLYFSGK
jgi:hypothetical protein